jgi:signal transduction histidine kinase
LILWIVCGMAILLTMFSVVVYGVLYRSLLSSFDEVLVSTARTVCGFVEQNREGFKVEADENQVPEFKRSAKPDYFQMWQKGGGVLARSTSLQGAELERLEGPRNIPVFGLMRLPDGRAGRAISLLFVPKTDEEIKEPLVPQEVVLVVARETATLDAGIRQLGWLLAIAAGGILIVAIFVGTFVVSQGLRPLHELALQIAAIRHHDLSSQIPLDRMPVEMAPVIDRLNDLLRRLEGAFRRERAFAADAAHELRTPLAGMRCTLEVALSRTRTEGEHRQAATECLEIIRRMQMMVEKLLALARIEDGQSPPDPKQVRIDELLNMAWRPYADKAQARGIAVEIRVPAALSCAADQDSLAVIFANLFENAAEYTNDGGRIEVRAGQTGPVAEISIANTGCSLTVEEARHVFERFWRGDAARSDTGIHSGLGLALVQRAMAGLGGTVSATVVDGAFTVRLSLPIMT